MIMELTTKTLLIGCGGSGIKTLTELNKCMSRNIDFREDMAEKIAYLVLDTDEHDLREFDDTIEYQMGHAHKPLVKTIHITDGCSQLNDIVEESFDGFTDKSDIVDMMKRYWWYSKDGEPFRAEDIEDVTTGAGQCGQISYLAAWKCMDEIEMVLGELLQETLLRDINNTESLGSQLKVYIVAGLAGGTGRGSWTLVAFKVRQYLQKMGLSKVRIEGIFFDASCFKNRWAEDREQKKSMFFNSATAISELSSWFRLRKIPDKQVGGWEKKVFSLPSLYHPMLDHTNDAITFREFKTKDINLVPPVQSAYLVFGESDTPVNLGNNDHYHNMAAAALYAKIVNAGKIGSGKSNMRSLIGSFASSTFGVDTYRIESYLNTRVQKVFLKELLAETDPELGMKVKKAVGTARGLSQDDFKKSFLGESHLRLPDNLTFGETDVMSDETSLLGTLMAAFAQDQTTGLMQVEAVVDPKKKTKLTCSALCKNLVDALVKQDAKKAQIAVDGLKLSKLSDAVIGKYFNAVLEAGGLSGASLTETLCKLVMGQFAQGPSLSLRRAQLYTDELLRTFTGYCTKLNSGVTVCGDDDNKVANTDALITKFKEAVRDKAKTTFTEDVKGLWLLANPFNKKEIDELSTDFEAYVRAAVFFKIKDRLLEFFNAAVDALTNIKKGLTLMGQLLDKSCESLNANLTRVFPEKRYDDIFNELFTNPEKAEKVQEAIPEFDDPATLYRRQLKPVLTSEELDKLLADPKNRSAKKEPITDTITRELENLLDLLCGDPAKAQTRVYATEEKARSKIPANIRDVVVRNVGLSIDSSNLSFTDRYFSFEAVLNRNIEAWTKLLVDTPTEWSGDLLDQLREYLGLDKSAGDDFQKEEESGKLKIVSEQAVKKAILSLAKTCKPWIRINESRPVSCLIVVPFSLEKYGVEKKKLEAELKAAFKVQKDTLFLNVLSPDDERAVSFPQDRILVYSSKLLGYGGSDIQDDEGKEEEDAAPIEKIASLNYWKDYVDLLIKAEDLNHDSSALFLHKGDHWQERSRGFAFLAPFFTMEPLKSLRWHPWLKEDPVDQAQAQIESVYRALFYAFLGNGMTPEDAELRKNLADFWCKMPLLEMEKDKADQEAQKGKKRGSESFTFSRKQQKWEGGEIVDSRPSAWRAGSELANSIDQVVEFLNGEGLRSLRENGGADLVASQQKGAAIRSAILMEAESFFPHIEEEIGKGPLAKLVDRCCDWIDKKKEDSNGKDRKCWEELSKFAENELKKLKKRG